MTELNKEDDISKYFGDKKAVEDVQNISAQGQTPAQTPAQNQNPNPNPNQNQNQNQTDDSPPSMNGIGSKPGELPEKKAPLIPNGKLKGAPDPTTDKLKDVRNEEREWDMRKTMLDQLFKMASEQRADQRYWAHHEAAQAATRPRPWKFTARTNGVTGQSSFKVQWFGDDGRKSSPTFGAGVSGGMPGGPDDVVGMINALLGGKGPQAGVKAGVKATGKGKPVPARRIEDGAGGEIALLPHQSWMPHDTEKGGNFSESDFLALGDPEDTGRFQGGYRDPAFRKNFIKARMGKLTQGEAGYERALKSAEAAWGKAASAYDAMFDAYGKGLLYYQDKRDSKKQGEKFVSKAAEGALKGGTTVRAEEAAAAVAMGSINAEKERSAIGAMGRSAVIPKRRSH